MRNPKDDIPAYNAMRRRQIEIGFGPEFVPVESRWWFGPLVWSITLLTFPFYVAWVVLNRKANA